MKDPHLAPEELAALAVSGDDEPAHLAGCERCRVDLDELRDLVAQLSALPSPPERMLEAAKAYYRKRRGIDALIEKLAEDPAMRAALHADPAAVIRRAGLDPTPELIAALRDTERGGSGMVGERIAAKLFWG
jgi:hypothetical protein